MDIECFLLKYRNLYGFKIKKPNRIKLGLYRADSSMLI